MTNAVIDEHNRYWTPVRMAIWALLAALALFFGWRDWVDLFYPKEGVSFDFCQEWLSARNWLTGRPVYSPQVEAYTLHTGFKPNRDSDMLPWNAHPPAAILLTLPFAQRDYAQAPFRLEHLHGSIISFVPNHRIS